MDTHTPMITKLGTRKLQKGGSTHILNIPNVVTDTLGWKKHDKIDVTMIDNEYLIFKKVKE